MQSWRSILIPMTLLCLVVVPLACKKQGNKTEVATATSTAPAQTGRWVVRYRPPASLQPHSYAALYSFNAISIVSPSIVYVAANYPDPIDKTERIPIVVKTTDGGANWTEIRIPAAEKKVPRLNAIRFVSPTAGWVAGADDHGHGFVLRTSDGGTTWSISALSAKLTPTSIYGDGSAFWVGGVAPKPGEEEDADDGPTDILFSSDKGVNWTSQYRLPVSVNNFCFLDSKTGWAAGNPNAVYHTTDGGRTWEAQSAGLVPGAASTQQQVSFSSVCFCDPLHGWIAGSVEGAGISAVESTENGGKSWSNLWQPQGDTINDVLFVNPNEGWVVSTNGAYVYHSADGGHSWQVEPIAFDQRPPLYRLAAVDASHIWAVGGGGIFYREAQ
jgi:photosystem II stability/assembly factor-like uncharacterized protein